MQLVALWRSPDGALRCPFVCCRRRASAADCIVSVLRVLIGSHLSTSQSWKKPEVLDFNLVKLTLDLPPGAQLRLIVDVVVTAYLASLGDSGPGLKRIQRAKAETDTARQG